MNDDILSRLRLLSASQKAHRFGDLLDDWPGEAADEIVRLRAELGKVRDDARWLLDMIRSACRKHNHPMAYQIVCPYCERITEVLGE